MGITRRAADVFPCVTRSTLLLPFSQVTCSHANRNHSSGCISVSARTVANAAVTLCLSPLFQLRVLSLCFFQDGDVRVSVLPESEEIVIGGADFGAGGFGVGG